MKTLIGIDWSQDHHDVRLHNEQGACLARFQVAHNLAGFEQLVKRIDQVNPDPSACLIAIETADNLLIDFLWQKPYRLYVLAPRFVQSSRGRQRASGARDDDSDAALLAEILRTDSHRLIAWKPDGAEVRQMRLLLSFIDDLTASIVQYNNRLQANLRRYYPQVLAAFSKVIYPLCLNFLITYPTPAAAAALSYTEFEAFCRQHHDTRTNYRPQRYAQLQQPAPPADSSLLAAYERQTPWLAQLLLSLVRQKQTAIVQLQQLFTYHPDHDIFASLPGAGDLLGPKLLVMFGDHRDRLPAAKVIQALAGTCPITVKSGKLRIVRFRRACNHTYRDAVQQFAMASIAQSPWATTYFDQALARGLTQSHAYRCLANRWLHIIWTLWQRHQTYDETYHWRQVQQRRRPLATTPLSATI